MHHNLSQGIGGVLATGFNYRKTGTAWVNHGDRWTKIKAISPEIALPSFYYHF
ncbi:hypothetical protein [Histophilus somni]|uniref:hypothetical protein n=1 Tax=Histophilus somni TaxID=731 RepID=UPI0018EA7EA5|nr:hypothetical protein [Histophilus somni]QQF78534.1 hypothetical protein JFL53_08460 [Histophilus somni]